MLRRNQTSFDHLLTSTARRYRSWSLLVLVCLVAVGTTSSAVAQIIFDTPVNYGVGQRPSGIAAADYDGDGDRDLAVVSDGPAGNLERIEFLLNAGDGTYSAGPFVLLPNSSSPTELIAADLDGDSDPDLAVILRDFNQVQTVINNGGVFFLGSTASVGDRARGMTARDYDGDTDIDLAVANRKRQYRDGPDKQRCRRFFIDDIDGGQ